MGNMAERTIRIPPIHEQRMLHSLYVGSQEGVPDDQRKRAEKLLLPEEEETRKMAGIMVTILTGNQAEQEVAKKALVLKFRETAPSEIGKPGTSDRRKPESLMDVNGELERLIEIIEVKENNGEHISDSLFRQFVDCQRTLYCIDGAATLAVQALMNAKDGTSGRLEAEVAILDKENGHIAIEQLLSGENDGGVLYGVGSRVVENVISDRGLIEAMTVMSTMVDGEGKIVEKCATPDNFHRIETAIEDAYAEANTGSERPRDQAAMVQNYLAYVMDRAGLTETHPAQTAPQPANTSQGGGVTPEDVEGLIRKGLARQAMSMGGQGKDGTPPEILAAMRAIEGNEGLRLGENPTRGQVRSWALGVVDTMSRNPTFHRVWYQAALYMEGELDNAVPRVEVGQDGKPIPFLGREKMLNEMKDVVRNIVMLRATEKGIITCGGAMGNYLTTTMDKDEYPDYQWDRGKCKAIERDTAFAKAANEVARMAFKGQEYTDDKGDIHHEGSDLVAGLSTEGRMLILAEEIGKKVGVTTEEARMGLAYFIVERYPKWVVWSHIESEKPGGLDKVPWMKAQEPFTDRRTGKTYHSIGWTEREINSKGHLGAVRIINSQFEGSVAGKSMIQQPLLGLAITPVELYRFKRKNDEGIKAPLEKLMYNFYLNLFDDEKDKDNKAVIMSKREASMRMSRWGVKMLARADAVTSSLIGGPAMEKLGSFDPKDVSMGIQKVADLLQGRIEEVDPITGEIIKQDMPIIAGNFLGDFIAIKVWKLLRSRNSVGYVRAVLEASNLMGVNQMQQKEVQSQADAFYGTSRAGGLPGGILAETIFGQNIKIETPDFIAARRMMETECGRPELANSLRTAGIVGEVATATGEFLSDLGFSPGGAKKKR